MIYRESPMKMFKHAFSLLQANGLAKLSYRKMIGEIV